MLTFSAQSWFIPLSQAEPITQCNSQAGVKKLEALSVFITAMVLVLGFSVGSLIELVALNSRVFIA